MEELSVWVLSLNILSFEGTYAPDEILAYGNFTNLCVGYISLFT